MRQNFNLFSRMGRRSFFGCGIFGDKWARGYVLQDTFGRYICSLIGHAKNTFEAEDRVICFRCFKVCR